MNTATNIWTTMNTSYRGQDVHIISLANLFERFHTNQHTGLSSSFVNEARAQYGHNTITKSKSPGYVWLLFKQLFVGFNLLFWLGAVFAFIGYGNFSTVPSANITLNVGVVVLVVILSNSILNVYQEMKSIKIIGSFAKLLPTIATVRRNNTEQQIVADELIPGDIIILQSGTKIPADCRFLVCNGLKINQSELTGESKPITATIECTSEAFMESTNIGFYSTLIEEGSGEAVVIATGDSTVFGKMSNVTYGKSNTEITSLRREINRFVLAIFLMTLSGISILWITWGAWLQFDHPIYLTVIDNCLNSIGMIVGFLPMGLPSAITLALTIVAKRMYKQNVLVKSLEIAETFDSVSVIATDKTGTLTANKMKVTSILWDTEGNYEVDTYDGDEEEDADDNDDENLFTKPMECISKGCSSRVHCGTVQPDTVIDNLSSQPKYKPTIDLKEQKNHNLKIQNQRKNGVFRDLLLAAALCNDAEKKLTKTKSKDNLELRLVGNAADVAFYKLCVYGFNMEIDEIRHFNPRLKVLPFNSLNKFMISANRLKSNDISVASNERTILITLKGAPDVVIQRCSSYKTNDNEILPLTAQIKEKLFSRQETLGKNGYRLIAICQQKFSQTQYDQRMLNYKSRKHIMILNKEDLNGLPENDYCFLGFFCLFDPPRMDAANTVFKIRQAHIRVAMITGDHSTTASAIGRQVNLFSSEIAEKNGIDTIQIGTHTNGRVILRSYRNETLLQEHVPEDVTRLTIENKTNRNDSIISQSSWFKRFWLWIECKFREPKSNISEEDKKIERIPYAIVVTGFEIDFLDDIMWNWILSHEELIFARTTPEQKLRVVTEFQRRGEIVAVIGDGTNDIPSLKCANVGIAMRSGTQASREVCDMILLNNNFASIAHIIEAGRLLSDNLKKVFVYLLPGGSWSEVWPVFINLWFGTPLTLSAFMAIVFCMLNDICMSLAMVTEKAENDIMSRPPAIRRKSRLFNLKSVIHGYLFVGNFECFTALFCFCYYWIDNGVPFYSFAFTYENFGIIPPIGFRPEVLNQMVYTSQSVYYSSLCIFQFFNFLATRTRYTSIIQQNPLWGKTRNLYGFGAMFISVCIQLIFTQIFWFNQIFNTAPIPVKYIMPTLGFGTLFLLIDELRKLCIRKFPHSIIAKIAW